MGPSHIVQATLLSVLFALNLLAADLARGEYPTKPIRFIVPFPPAGLADVVGRLVASPLSHALGQQVIVDNRPGADGAIAAEIALKAQPDGHTIFMGTNSPMSAVPSLRKKPPYH